MKYSKITGGFYDPKINGGMPSDAVELSQSEYLALLAAQASGKRIVSDGDGNPVAIDPPAPTEDEIIASLTGDVQGWLDSEAKTRGYDGILSLCTYVDSTNPTFATEGQAGVEWRDTVWGICHTIMADVQAGNRPVPTRDELIAELPPMVWP